MKKIILFFLGTFIFLNSIHAQFGIGTDSPDSSALVELSSTSQGLLIPRMDTASRVSIINPAYGLMIYDTSTNTFWFFDSVNWLELSDTGEVEDIGIIAAFDDVQLSTDWLILDGSSVLVVDYPVLSLVYPNWVNGTEINLPDYKGLFLAGANSNSQTPFTTYTPSTVATDVNDKTANPNSGNFSVNTTGNHGHTSNVTQTGGNHNHRWTDYTITQTVRAGSGNQASNEGAPISDEVGIFRVYLINESPTHTHSISSIGYTGNPMLIILLGEITKPDLIIYL